MCGIVGLASRTPYTDRSWLARARDAMLHRGPDDGGEWWSSDHRVALGQRRLAIIDLSAAGHQPMLNATGDVCITFNGEIYNYLELRQQLADRGHSFRSGSDTEVLLAAYREWGFDCLSHLNGMFAFALYDSLQGHLFLARDRAGEKPLFYHLHDGTLCFASELKALMIGGPLERRIDRDALDCYLAMGYVPGDRCMIRGANKLPPGHAMQFDLRSGATRTWRYWELPAPVQDAGGHDTERGENELLDECEALLQDAVRLQLVADVPVGVLLSGGVDSSLVTAAAARSGQRIKTFTVTFPAFGQYDEAGHARLIARHFDTEHIELQAGVVEPEMMLLMARQFDEPIIDSSMIPTYLVSRLVREHCTVALGGDGADELFGGYPTYDRLLWTQSKLAWLPASLRALAGISRGVLPTGFRGRNWLQVLNSDLARELPLVAAYFDSSERRSLIDLPAHESAERIRSARLPPGVKLLERATRMDFSNYLAEDILVKVDRASMLNSLEMRAPFLDRRMIEFAFGRVPARLKATMSDRKVLLKKLTARLLPPQFDRQRKQGFSIPIAAWLRAGAWRQFVKDVLLDEQCLFDKPAILRLLHGQDRGRANGERLFGLTLFELWRREYRMSI